MRFRKISTLTIKRCEGVDSQKASIDYFQWSTTNEIRAYLSLVDKMETANFNSKWYWLEKTIQNQKPNRNCNHFKSLFGHTSSFRAALFSNPDQSMKVKFGLKVFLAAPAWSTWVCKKVSDNSWIRKKLLNLLIIGFKSKHEINFKFGCFEKCKWLYPALLCVCRLLFVHWNYSVVIKLVIAFVWTKRIAKTVIYRRSRFSRSQ